MRIKPGFMMRPMGEECVVVALGDAADSFHGMVRLNGTAGFLWGKMEELGDFDVAQLADALVAQYGIDAAQAAQDAGDLVSTLRGAGVLE